MKRRELLRLGVVAAAGLCVAPVAHALPKNSRGRLTVYRFSTRGRRASTAIKIRNANLRFKNFGVAQQYRLRPGDSSRIVPIDVSVETARLWFPNGALIRDLRRLPGRRSGQSRIPATAAGSGMPSGTAISLENSPNPFQGSTTITFTLPREGPVSLEVFDPMGRVVARLLNGEATTAGLHRVAFNRPELPSGVYWARLHTLEGAITRRMLAVR